MTLLLVTVLCASVLCLTLLAARHLDGVLWRRHLLAFRLTLPAELTLDDAAAWLGLVAAYTQAPRLALLPEPPVALELIGTREGIQHVLVIPERARAALLSTLRATLPGIRLSEYANYLDVRPSVQVAAELTMTSAQRPLAVDRADAMSAALLAALQPLRRPETIVVQVILTGAGVPRPIPSATSTRAQGRPLMDSDLTDSEAIRAARAKQADPLLALSVRVAVGAGDIASARAIFHRVYGAFRSLNAQGVRVLRRWWLPSTVVSGRVERLALPLTRWPLLLGSREAAGLMGLITRPLPGLPLGAARQLPPPTGLPKRGTQVAVSNYPGTATPLRLSAPARAQHLHVVGPTGVGKSTMLANMVLQDIAAGYSTVVIDPKADLCADLLARLPEDRLDDIVVLDPSATDQPVVGFNILQAAHDELQRELVVDHVIHIWHELYSNFWGPRSEDILRGALLTLTNTRAADGSAFTILEVPALLNNGNLRRFVLAQPTVPESPKDFWEWYGALKLAERQHVVGPVLNKLRAASLRTPIRLMLGQSQGLNLARLMNSGKVLLVPLGKGTVGIETASLIGTLLLSTVWHGLLARTALPASQRRLTTVYIDEAQDILRLPVDLADMLAQARSLGGAFTLAHQHMGQLTDKQVRAALLGTVRSTIAFQCGSEDAALLARQFAPQLTADDLRGLGAYEVAARLSAGDQTVAPATGSTVPLPPAVRDGQDLARVAQARYGTPRAAIDEAIRQRLQVPVDAAAGRRGSATVRPTIGRVPRSGGGRRRVMRARSLARSRRVAPAVPTGQRPIVDWTATAIWHAAVRRQS